MKRVGIAQILPGHDECTVPLILALNRLGVYADVYINNELRERRGNIFESLSIEHHEIYIDKTTNLRKIDLPLQGNRVFWLDVMGNKIKKLILLNKQHSLPIMFWTTFANKPSEIFKYCQLIGFHLYAFIHDASNSHLSQTLAHLSSVTPVVFSSGMVDAFSCHAEKQRALKFYLSPISTLSHHHVTQSQANKDSSRLRIAVPGRVSYKRRDYDLLINFAASFLRQEFIDLEPKFVIAGAVSGDDGQRFMDQLAKQNLLGFFECPCLSLNSSDVPFMSYKQLFNCLLSCDLAVSNSYAVKGDYSKVSGAINLCINFYLPVLYLCDYPLYQEYEDTASIIINSHDSAQVAELSRQITHFVSQKKEETFFLKESMELWNNQVIEEILSKFA